MFTVLGSSGFIGGELLRHLQVRGHECRAPARHELDQLLAAGPDLGHVIYCIGLTADFRERPIETVEAHVGLLAKFLAKSRFQSFLYLSSTRVYQRAKSGREEEGLLLHPQEPSDLYNLSKLTGEGLCLSMPWPTIRVVRLSNVYGRDLMSENFLTSVIRSAVKDGRVALRSSRASAKDYVGVEDVVCLLEKIALTGLHRLYNLASGQSVTNGEILDRLTALTGCSLAYEDAAPTITFPEVSVARISEEFGFRPLRLLDCLSDLVDHYREGLGLAHRD